MLIQPWRIEMLGGLQLRRGEESVTRFKSQKVASLLAYLAFYPSRRHLREELLTLLWPDDDLDAARNRLRVGLSSLRRQLEPPGVDSGEVLISDRVTASLRPGAFTTDIAQFENAFAAALHTENPEEQARLLTEAIEAYGGLLLPGFYEEWILSERERLAQSHLDALRRLALCLTQEGKYERALEYARRAARSDPYREETHRDVMRLYVAVRQPSAALEQYEQWARLCRDAFGTEPTASIQRLARQIATSLGHPDRLISAARSFSASTLQPGPLKTPAAPSQPRPRAPSLLPKAPLPVALTRLFGREKEREAVCGLLAPRKEPGGAARLLTLTGIGGTGKTRLAIAVAQSLQAQFPDRIWFVPLADLADARQICDAIVEAMSLPRLPQLDPLAQMLKALALEPALLILDNFEHLVEQGAELVEAILAHAPHLTCLVTSRRSLGLAGEQEFPSFPLPVPAQREEQKGGTDPKRPGSPASSLSSLMQYPSIALFVDRAQAALPDFQLTARNAEEVAGLCRELEGIPLAIELAAARSRLLTPAQMRTYLTRRFDLLVNRRAGKDARHRSLHAALDWSYFLLSPEARSAFALLSVFQGGATLAAIEAVGGNREALELLEQLHCDSLIQAEEGLEEKRFRMLETIREYAAEHLNEEEGQAARQRHAAFYLHLAEEAELKLKGPEQPLWLDRLQGERENLRMACDTFLSCPQGTEGGLRLTRSLWRFWMLRGDLKEGREKAEAALSRPDAPRFGPLYADALNAAGAMASTQEDYARARRFYERELAYSGDTGYSRGAAWASCNLGGLEIRRGNYPAARAFLEAGLARHREDNNIAGIALSLGHLAIVCDKMGEPSRAKSLYAECLALHRSLGDSIQVASALGNLGSIAERENDFASARAYQEQSIAIHQELGNRRGMAQAAGNLGIVAMKQGDYTQAKTRFLECLALFRELEMPHAAALALGELGSLEILAGNYREARRLMEEKLAIERELNSREGMIYALSSLGNILVEQEEYERARNCLSESLSLAQEIGLRLGIAVALEACAVLAQALHQPKQAVRLYGAADALRKTLNTPLSPVQRKSLEQRLGPLLTDKTYAAALDAGISDPVEAAIGLALNMTL